MNKIAAVQICSSTVVADNLTKIAEQIKAAVQQGAELILLPENFALMARNSEQLLAIKEKFGQGPIQDFLAEQARRWQVWIVAGAMPLACEDEKRARSACLVFSAQGECVVRYDKIHLFDVAVSDVEKYLESQTIQAGDKTVVVDSPFGKLGLAICYDLRFPELFRQLLQDGAEIILLPAAFTVPTGEAHWEVLTRARAIENGCYLLAAAQTGQHDNGRKTFGHSVAIDPWGKVLQCLPEKEGIVMMEINLSYVQEIRRKLPMLVHRRL